MRTNSRNTLLASAFVILASALSVNSALAAAFQHAESYVLPGTETIHDDLYAGGKTLDIQGTVDGDLVVAGQSVLISGDVTGDVIAAAREISISGHVGGTVRAAGNNITVSGTVGHDVLAACGTLVVGSGARVGRDVLAGAGTSSFAGQIDRDVRVGSGSATFSGSVGGVVYAHATSVSLGQSAVLEKDLFVTSKNDVVKAPGATVRGRIERHVPVEREHRRAFGGPVAGWIRGLIGFLIFGGLLHLLLAGAERRAGETLGRSPLASFGLGILLAFAVPCAALALFILGVMVGGWWIGLGALPVYLLLLATGYVIAAGRVGALVLSRTGRGSPAYGWSLLLGLFLVGLVAAIPVLGWMVGWAVALFGVGALGLAWYRGRAAAPSAPAGTAPAAPAT
jgi:cytoskeletal protein CcmA (bactofilin family)